MAKQKVSVTINSELLMDIEAYLQMKNISRSVFFEQILLNWQQDYVRKQMIEGYKAMSKENAQIAEDFEALDNEVWTNE